MKSFQDILMVLYEYKKNTRRTDVPKKILHHIENLLNETVDGFDFFVFEKQNQDIISKEWKPYGCICLSIYDKKYKSYHTIQIFDNLIYNNPKINFRIEIEFDKDLLKRFSLKEYNMILMNRITLHHKQKFFKQKSEKNMIKKCLKEIEDNYNDILNFSKHINQFIYQLIGHTNELFNFIYINANIPQININHLESNIAYELTKNKKTISLKSIFSEKTYQEFNVNKKNIDFIHSMSNVLTEATNHQKTLFYKRSNIKLSYMNDLDTIFNDIDNLFSYSFSSRSHKDYLKENEINLNFYDFYNCLEFHEYKENVINLYNGLDNTFKTDFEVLSDFSRNNIFLEEYFYTILNSLYELIDSSYDNNKVDIPLYNLSFKGKNTINISYYLKFPYRLNNENLNDILQRDAITIDLERKKIYFALDYLAITEKLIKEELNKIINIKNLCNYLDFGKFLMELFVESNLFETFEIMSVTGTKELSSILTHDNHLFISYNKLEHVK